MSKQLWCACVDTVMTDGQGSVAVATCSSDQPEEQDACLDSSILQKTKELNLPASSIISQVRARMRAHITLNMVVSDADLKSYLKEAMRDRGWTSDGLTGTINSSMNWARITERKLGINAFTLKSVVMTLHYAKQTWIWLSQRDEWDVNSDPHPISPFMVQVAKFVEFENLDGVTYYASRKVIYLATQVVEEEAAAALFVILQGLRGPIAPFSY